MEMTRANADYSGWAMATFKVPMPSIPHSTCARREETSQSAAKLTDVCSRARKTGSEQRAVKVTRLPHAESRDHHDQLKFLKWNLTAMAKCLPSCSRQEFVVRTGIGENR
jgi:hypothetical protein